MKILNEVDFPAKNLEFEITESSYIKRMDDAALNIYKLKKLGCKIALDDFGTGYSSLRFLTQLQIDIVKIDRSFTNNVCSDPEKLKFINIIVQLAHLLKCKVIAEGVETAEQIDKLSELGVDIMQGYYWGKPLRMSDNIQNLEAADK
jgi:EAL domain-containing protein (putative c-di-GMP-specific phosphodiesterase class I)